MGRVFKGVFYNVPGLVHRPHYFHSCSSFLVLIDVLLEVLELTVYTFHGPSVTLIKVFKFKKKNEIYLREGTTLIFGRIRSFHLAFEIYIIKVTCKNVFIIRAHIFLQKVAK